MKCEHIITVIFTLHHDQGLKYNFQGGGTVQLPGSPVRPPSVQFLGPYFNSELSDDQ